jgi:type VI secretion system protein ImpL
MQLIFKPLAVDAAIAELTIDVDGQILKYGHTPQPPMQVNWPGPGGSSQIRMQMVSADGASPDSAVFDGPWALLRLFDRARLQPTSQPERYIATWDFGGKKAQLEIMASSIQNPIRLRELEQFRCPGAL